MHIRSILAIARKDALDILLNKATLTVMLTPIFLALLFVVIGGLLGGHTTNALVYNPARSGVEQRIDSAFTGIKVTYTNSPADVTAAFGPDGSHKDTSYALGLVVPADFDAALRSGAHPQLNLYVDGGQINNQQRQLLLSALADYSRSVANPQPPANITVATVNPPSPSNSSLQDIGVVYSVAVLLSSFLVGTSLVPGLLAEEKEKKTLRMLMVAPASFADVVAAKLLVGLVYQLLLALLVLTINRAIQARVEAEAKKSSKAAAQFASTMGKAAAKASVGMALSFIPIVGPIAGALGGESTEAFVDWLHGFLSKPDMEFYLDPKGRLDNDFLGDLSRVASQLRIVLITDTYEQMTALDDWMRELARRLPKNVLLVIVGRTVPEWNRVRQDWMGKAEVVELKEMTPDHLRTLVHRYYGYIRSSDPDPKQVEAIVQFARGLPMVATTVVQLWVKCGLEDFQAVRPQVVADLVDRLLEGVPKEMRPAFEASAVLRYFNAEALDVLLDGGNAENLYAELRRWPFIRSRKEGLAVHDTMREMINEALHVRTPEYFRTLHERAAAYYEAQLEKSTGDERERYALERLYHQVRADEVSGIQSFQELAEELTRYRLVNRLRALLNDVNIYPLESENGKLWREYYNARLAHFEARTSYAEKVYQAIGENERAEPKLRAYTLCDWGGILCRTERLHQPGVEEKAIQALESSLKLGPVEVPTDVKLAMSWVHLSRIYAAQANWEKALFYLNQARHFFAKRSDSSGLLTVLEEERAVYWGQGNLRKTLDLEKEMWNIYTVAGEAAYLRIRIPPTWEWAWAGRYADSEKELRVVLEIAKSSQDQEYLCRRTRDLALYLGFQGKCSEAQATAEESLSLAYSFGSAGETDLFGSLTHYGIVYLMCGKVDKAEEYLTRAISVIQKLHAHLDIAPLYLAAVYEVLKSFDRAEHFYQRLRKVTRPLCLLLLPTHSHPCTTLQSLLVG